MDIERLTFLNLIPPFISFPTMSYWLKNQKPPYTFFLPLKLTSWTPIFSCAFSLQNILPSQLLYFPQTALSSPDVSKNLIIKGLSIKRLCTTCIYYTCIEPWHNHVNEYFRNLSMHTWTLQNIDIICMVQVFKKLAVPLNWWWWGHLKLFKSYKTKPSINKLPKFHLKHPFSFQEPACKFPKNIGHAAWWNYKSPLSSFIHPIPIFFSI